MADTIWDFTAADLRGQPVPLERYRGSVVLVVNVASRCGFTPQYAGLEALYRRHRDAGFVVLGFPCNQFGGQEPGTSREIETFCRDRFDVTFPMFEKVDVNGPAAHPLFVWLKAKAPGALGSKAVKWNFTKFLVDRDGAHVERFAPRTPPEAVEPAIIERLGRG
ncbi:MAG: glutathione peroxidase [Acidobacteriota bacterium]|nr:MAG: glutathione peroxidase [Acidobacteriota bacterium]